MTRLITVTPRGFCAGVVRAIEIVNRQLIEHGAPVYVRKEIVHNHAVVEDFKSRGVVFVDELDQVPAGQTVIFSAHGISPAVRQEAETLGLTTIDATCPLVTKVHREVVRHAKTSAAVVLIGHAGHDEVLGTMGEAPDHISLVSDLDDVQNLDIPETCEVAYASQTTLSVDETRDIVEALRTKYPRLIEPNKSDICYATQNRQDAVKELVKHGIDHLLVVGSSSSSNSRRLCEVAHRLGIPANLIDGAADLDLPALQNIPSIGLTAGASAPEHLVEEVIVALAASGRKSEELIVSQENEHFRLP